ncbi:hypothetical protein DPMN_026397 [Dreissena polymorpha]|uniref:DDE Tnp4 domain-containing protein n=1 Tax=Dreissena polymorpha TaxID=45954 RepID=A0A9D4LSH3_DREPO|nr:hypothetical protein DPMN_026397 [Dreissena polymorpha]
MIKLSTADVTAYDDPSAAVDKLLGRFDGFIMKFKSKTTDCSTWQIVACLKTLWKRSIRAPNSIERAFGVWKRTFHVLHGEIRMKPAKVSRIIIACAVLHNLRLMWGNQQWIRNL